MEFYTDQPTATTSWRLAVLMGANSRTYKFALATALLEHATAGRTDVTMADLARPYAMTLVQHLAEMPQVPGNTRLGESDFLTVAQEESTASLKAEAATERLVDAAVASMPGMVMQKFHNLAGGTQVPMRFYEVKGRGRDRRVVLTPSLLRIGQGDVHSLAAELDARWRIVESSWSAGIGPSLVSEGISVDLDLGVVTDKRRRRSVAGVVPAVIGFQYGRCLICDDPIGSEGRVAVDHVFPFSLMARGFTNRAAGIDLDSVWNLAPTHAACNARKNNRPPTREEMQRLGKRNQAIMCSPHPLRRTLQLTLKAAGFRGDPADWWSFLNAVLRQ